MTNKKLSPESGFHSQGEMRLVGTIILAVALAWLPILLPYVRFADDFRFQAMTFTDFFRSYGVWRFLGLSYLKVILAAGGSAPGAMTLAFHILTVIAFFFVLRQARLPRTVALFAAIIFGVCPAAFEVMTWTAASFVIPATALFLFSLIVAVSPYFAKHYLVQSVVIGLTSLLANLLQENLFFAFLIVPFWRNIARYGVRDESSKSCRNRMVSVPALAGVAFGLCFFALAHWRFPGQSPHKVVIWNSHVFLTSVAYQSTCIYTLEPLFRQAAYSYLAALPWRVLGPAALLLTAILGICLCVLRLDDRGPTKHDLNIAKPTVSWLLLLFLTGAIFVLAGGMSLDSRKSYAFLPSLVGAFIVPCLLAVRLFLWKPAKVKSALMITILIGALSVWLIAGLWRAEVLRGQRLAKYILDNRIQGPIQLTNTDTRRSSLKYIPVKFGSSVDDEEIINASLERKSKIWLSDSQDAVHLMYSGEAWQARSD